MAEHDLPADNTGRQIREDGLREDQLAAVRQSVKQGIKDIEQGRFTEFDEAGLLGHFLEIGRRGRLRLESEAARLSQE